MSREFVDCVTDSINTLSSFVQELSGQFSENLHQFNVRGGLALKVWVEKAYERAYEQLKNDVAQINIQKQFGEFAALFVSLQETVQTDAPLELNIQEEDSLDQHEAFLAKLGTFNEKVDSLLQLETLLLNFTPGLDIRSQFAKGEEASNQSLSGGEKSVISLCLAACCKQSSFIAIDEINQGMDDVFETAAHKLILKLDGQVLVTSPKLGSKMEFDEGVAIHVIIRDHRSK